MTPTPDAPGLPELNVSWSDHFARQGDMAMSHNHVAFKAAESWILANISALSRPLPSDWVAVPRSQLEGIAERLSVGMEAFVRKESDNLLELLQADPSAPAEGGETATEPLAQGECVGVWSGNAAARGEPGGPVKWATGLTYSSLPDGAKLYASPQPAADGFHIPYEQHEREILKVIDERDRREAVIDRILDTVLGTDRHEWSSAYSFEDEINDVADRMVDLEIKAAAPNPHQPSASVGVPHQECYSHDFDTWFDSPDDSAFVDGLKVGDTYKLQVSHYSIEREYVVTKVPEETNDDYEVRPVIESALTTAAGGGE